MAGEGNEAEEFRTPQAQVVRRAVLASAIGNATEWYDYGVYAYLVVELTHNFFPHAGNVATLLVYAVSFVLRPLGGLVWGPLGDKIGRSKVMSFTIILMSVGTFLVGVLPTYSSVGVWAVVGLVILRVVQGFSTGGEYGGAATFMAEYAPDKRRGFWGSFLEFGTLAGFTGGLAIVLILRTVLSEPAMLSWGWRIPFLVGLPLGLVGLYLRLRMEDTPVFQELTSKQQQEKGAGAALSDLFRGYWPIMLRLFGLVIALNIADYTLLTYMPTYLQATLNVSSVHTDIIMIIGQVIMMAVINRAGWLSDKIGRKPCWWMSFGLLFVLAVPMFYIMSLEFGWAIVGFAVLGLSFLLQLGTISATFPAMFPTHVRYAGMANAYNIATAAFGGTASVVDDALVQATGNALMPAFYVMLAMVIGAVALVKVPETAGRSLRGRRIPGTVASPEPAT